MSYIKTTDPVIVRLRDRITEITFKLEELPQRLRSGAKSDLYIIHSLHDMDLAERCGDRVKKNVYESCAENDLFVNQSSVGTTNLKVANTNNSSVMFTSTVSIT